MNGWRASPSLGADCIAFAGGRTHGSNTEGKSLALILLVHRLDNTETTLDAAVAANGRAFNSRVTARVSYSPIKLYRGEYVYVFFVHNDTGVRKVVPGTEGAITNFMGYCVRLKD